ncbi:MAG: hypothetical protein ACUVQT_07905, partial [bacterium]
FWGMFPMNSGHQYFKKNQGLNRMFIDIPINLVIIILYGPDMVCRLGLQSHGRTKARMDFWVLSIMICHAYMIMINQTFGKVRKKEALNEKV